MSKTTDLARNLLMMGLEVDSDSDGDGTLASQDILALSRILDYRDGKGLLEVLASIESAAVGSADVHDGDPDHADAVVRLRRFATLIAAARREIT